MAYSNLASSSCEILSPSFQLLRTFSEKVPPIRSYHGNTLIMATTPRVTCEWQTTWQTTTTVDKQTTINDQCIVHQWPMQQWPMAWRYRWPSVMDLLPPTSLLRIFSYLYLLPLYYSTTDLGWDRSWFDLGWSWWLSRPDRRRALVDHLRRDSRDPRSRRVESIAWISSLFLRSEVSVVVLFLLSYFELLLELQQLNCGVVEHVSFGEPGLNERPEHVLEGFEDPALDEHLSFRVRT